MGCCSGACLIRGSAVGFALLTGLLWGLAPPTTLGTALGLAGAFTAVLSIRGHWRGDLLRGLLVGGLWYGLALSWFPEAWSLFSSSAPWAPFSALVVLQACLPAGIWGASGLAIARGIPRPVAIGTCTALGAGLAEWIQPLPVGVSITLTAAPVLLWPAAIGGRALLEACLLTTAACAVQDRRAWLLPLTWLLVGTAWLTSNRSEETVRVGLMQPNFGTFDSRRASTANDRAERVLALTQDLESQGATWIATPEGVWPIDPGRSGGARDEALQWTWRDRAPVLLGVSIHDEDLPTNSALFLERGLRQARVDKHTLVPWAERATWLGGRDRFRSGRGLRILDIAGTTAGVLICYEDVLPSALREVAQADLVVAMSHDGWLGDKRGSKLHLAASRLAAVETGKGIVRPTTNGRSAVIDSRGRLKWLAPWVDGDVSDPPRGFTQVAEVHRAPSGWNGALIGPWFSIAAGVSLLGLAVLRPTDPTS